MTENMRVECNATTWNTDCSVVQTDDDDDDDDDNNNNNNN